MKNLYTVSSFAMLSLFMGFLVLTCLDKLPYLIPAEIDVIELMVVFGALTIMCAAQLWVVALAVMRTYLLTRLTVGMGSATLINALRLEVCLHMLWCAQNLLSGEHYRDCYNYLKQWFQNPIYVLFMGLFRRIAMLIVISESICHHYTMEMGVFMTHMSRCTIMLHIVFSVIWTVEHNIPANIIRGLVRVLQIILITEWDLRILLSIYQVLLMVMFPVKFNPMDLQLILLGNPNNFTIVALMIGNMRINLTLLFMSFTWGAFVEPKVHVFEAIIAIWSLLYNLFSTMYSVATTCWETAKLIISNICNAASWIYGVVNIPVAFIFREPQPDFEEQKREYVEHHQQNFQDNAQYPVASAPSMMNVHNIPVNNPYYPYYVNPLLNASAPPLSAAQNAIHLQPNQVVPGGQLVGRPVSYADHVLPFDDQPPPRRNNRAAAQPAAAARRSSRSNAGQPARRFA